MSLANLHSWKDLWIQWFHGTWKLSHDFWNNKYTGGVVQDTRDILGSILNQWLKPFPDPLNPGFEETISITIDPKYALLYALLYAEKGTSDKYGVDRWKEWKRILWKIIVEAKPWMPWKYKTKDRRIVWTKEFRKWTISFNNSDYHKKFLWWFRWMIWGESNIEGNFPIVLWIGQIDATTKEMPWWNEIRVHWWILPENISAIFVPRDKMNTLPATDIPIYPLEDFSQEYF